MLTRSSSGVQLDWRRFKVKWDTIQEMDRAALTFKKHRQDKLLLVVVNEVE